MTVSTHTYAAFLIGTPDQPLDVKAGTVSLDAGRAPHVEADVLIGPVDPVVHRRLIGDPRDSPRIRLEVEADTPAGVQFRSFDLGVRSRPITYLDGDYGLTLASDEALLLDYAVLADDTGMSAMTSGRDIVDYVLDIVIPGTSLAAGLDFTVLVDADDEALIWRAGDTAYDFLQPLCEAAGFRLVCDEQRVWTLRDEGFIVPGTITVRHLVNLIDATENIDLSAGFWFDAAVTRYTWTDTADVQHKAVDAYSSVASPIRVRTFDKTTAYPGTGFSEYAVRRAQGRGREVSATCVSDWRAKAEQSLEVTLPDTPIQTGIVQSVTFDLSVDEMTVTTRSVDTPAAAWVLIPDGESWLDSPVGEDWISEVV